MKKLLLFTAISLFIVCKDYRTNKYNPLKSKRDSGYYLLSQGKFKEAKDEFKIAEKEYGGGNDPYILYGYFWSDMLLLIKDTAKTVNQLILIFGGQFSSGLQTKEVKSGITGLLDGLIRSTFFDRVLDNISRLRKIEEIVGDSGDFSVKIESIPLKENIGGLISIDLDFGGEHDLGDVYFLDSLLSVFSALVYTALSLDMNVELTYALDIPSFAQQISKMSALVGITKLVVYLLKSSPRVLTVSSTEDVENIKKGLINFADRMLKFNDYLLNRDDKDTSDDIFYLGEREGKEGIILRYKERGKIRDNLVTETKDVEKLSTIVSKIKNHLEKGVDRISWSQDFVPLFSITIVSFINSGILDQVINFALAFADDKTRDMVARYLKPEFLKPSLISGLITSATGDVFQFDFYTMFNNLMNKKTSLRNWLPFWTEREQCPKGCFDDNFILEWDCGAELYDESSTGVLDFDKTGGLLCKEVTQDSSHFLDGATFFSFENKVTFFSNALTFSVSVLEEVRNSFGENLFNYGKDGKRFAGPYILFQDPSFGELLYLAPTKAPGVSDDVVDCGSLGKISGTEFKKYNENRLLGNCALNFILLSIVEGIIQIIRQSPFMFN